VQIGILGPLEVHGDGGQAVAIAGSRLRRLLTRLALDAGRVVPAAELVEAVWVDDPPHDVANALQSLVSRLRRALGDPALVQQVAAGYRLDLPREQVDAYTFVERAATGRRALQSGDPRGASALLASALRCWRGSPLADADDAPYAAAPIARWDEIRLSAAADRIEAELQLGNAAAVVPELEELVAANPLRERFVGQLMTALAGTGRTADALAAYESLRGRLADLLGADPGPDLQAQHLALLRGERQAAAEPSPAARRTNLRSAVSSFIGREAELARIGELVAGNRLTTIVGPGGAGKTRLATEAAAPLTERYRDGVWLVELAPVTDESAIAQAVLGAFGLRDTRILDRRSEMGSGMTAVERVFDTLADSDALLVIDNCEHLIGGVAEFAESLLSRCPQVRALATSREPLGLPGEALVSIPPLGLPPADATPEQATGYPAVQLLLARGRASSAEFVLDEHTVRPVIDIVRRLDGLPLAIELAAARLRVLPVTQIAERLGDRFRLLAGGMRTSVARHRTLRAVVEWSWDLLTPQERLLAERLAVFPAGATVESAAAVCAPCGADDAPDPGGLAAADIPDLLLALVDKSLLQVVRDGSAFTSVRYRMLETIREYGVERLDERGELAAARGRHAAFFAALAHRLDPVLRTAGQLEALAEITAERDNMLAAVRYLGDSADGEAALQLVRDLSWYWNITGGHSELAVWSEFVLDATEGLDSPNRVRVEAVRLLARLGSVPRPEDTWEAVQAELGRVGAELAEIGDPIDPPTMLTRIYIGFFGQGGTLVDELFQLGRSSPDPWIRAMTLSIHVMYLENNGDVDRMRTEVDEAYAAFSAIGDRWGLSSLLGVRAGIRSMDGDIDGATADYQQALAYLDQLGSTEDDMLVHLRMAGLRLRQHDFAGAREHVAAVRTGRPGKPIPMERVLLGDAASISILVAEGAVEEANERAAELRRRVPEQATANPMYGHLLTLVGAVCSMPAVLSGDLATAEADLLRAYPAAVSTADHPLMAGVAVSVAALADALGRPQDGAEILGAAAVLRGADDHGDVGIGMVRDRLIQALGQQAYQEAYDAGRSLSQDTAAKRIDPALLLQEEPPESTARRRDMARAQAVDSE
jgi:predicted ATPase/DNA-binding SARP family transcriptional activator